jgi:hypothetical protein
MGDTAYRKKEKEEIKPHEITCNQNNQLKYRVRIQTCNAGFMRSDQNTALFVDFCHIFKNCNLLLPPNGKL